MYNLWINVCMMNARIRHVSNNTYVTMNYNFSTDRRLRRTERATRGIFWKLVRSSTPVVVFRPDVGFQRVDLISHNRDDCRFHSVRMILLQYDKNKISKRRFIKSDLWRVIYCWYNVSWPHEYHVYSVHQLIDNDF